MTNMVDSTNIDAMKPSREQILKQLRKSRPGTEIKFENGRIMAFVDMMKNEKAWIVLAYEDEVYFDVQRHVTWKGWSL